MTSYSFNSSRKLNDIFAKLDVLITLKNEKLSKLNKLEIAKITVIGDLEDLKKSFSRDGYRGKFRSAILSCR